MKGKKNIILIISVTIVILVATVIAIQQKKESDKGLTEITAVTIANADNKSEYYGKIVTGYDCTNNAGVNAWKIFYANENNIYLIADDYIASEYCPSSKTQKITTYSESNYELSMDDVIKDYNGSEDITDERIKALNSDYFNRFKYVNTNNSMKALAYMLDTNVWSVFAGEKAEYAVGGPSIEMFLESYSQKHKVDYQAKSDELGYRISVDGGKTWDFSIPSILDNSDNLYVISSKEKASQMWLASPSCYTRYNLMRVSFVGAIASSGFASRMQGFRPLVCLKSDVFLEKQEDGTFMIK